MKFYIASSLGNYEQVRELSGRLKNAGWEHTFDWTVYCPVKEMDVKVLRSIGEREFAGIEESDVVIILTPRGRGTHTELGIALGLNKLVYLCHYDDSYFKLDDNTSAFYWLSQVKQIVGNIEDIAEELLKL